MPCSSIRGSGDGAFAASLSDSFIFLKTGTVITASNTTIIKIINTSMSANPDSFLHLKFRMTLIVLLHLFGLKNANNYL